MATVENTRAYLNQMVGTLYAVQNQKAPSDVLIRLMEEVNSDNMTTTGSAENREQILIKVFLRCTPIILGNIETQLKKVKQQLNSFKELQQEAVVDETMEHEKKLVEQYINEANELEQRVTQWSEQCPTVEEEEEALATTTEDQLYNLVLGMTSLVDDTLILFNNYEGFLENQAQTIFSTLMHLRDLASSSS